MRAAQERGRHRLASGLWRAVWASVLSVGCFWPVGTQAAEAAPINAGDTAWVLVASALVLMMTAPGLALFYGGLVRRKNVLGTLMHSFILLAMVSVQWVLWGYSIAFGPDIGGVLGSLHYVGLTTIGNEPGPYADTIPHLAFMSFQGMFAAFTPALITGAFAERMKFKTFLVFGLLWATCVYDPLAHWVWGKGGWINTLGVLDFAGGTVVHISSGASALVCAMVIGRRRGFPSEYMPPHNLPFAVTGAALLWVGWLGFNAGSALQANALAANAFVTTNTAAAAAALTWLFAEWHYAGKPTLLGAVSGAVAGLVAITPGAGFVSPLPAIIIGGIAGIVCFGAVVMKSRWRYDDSLDVVAVHGIGGTWGALATGLFASTAVNAHGRNGLFLGNVGTLGIQSVAIVATWIFAALVTLIILKLLDATMGLRIPTEHEQMGLDLSQHNEAGYTM